MKLLSLANPVTVTKGALGLTGSALGLVDTLARTGARLALSGVAAWTAPAAPVTPAEVTRPPGPRRPPEPQVVLPEPHAPDEPPVDVVGDALRAEAARGDRAVPEGAGLAHEPRGASRDEEHGAAALRQATVDDIAEEAAAALE